MKNKIRILVAIINGEPQSGKDTFVNMCVDIADATKYCCVKNISSIDMCNKALEIIGWDCKTKDYDVRNLLCDMKQFAIKNGDIPTKYMIEYIFKKLYSNDDDDILIFCHIREPEEIKKLTEALNGLHMIGLGYTTIRIVRSDNYIELTNDSDRNTQYYNYNNTIYNNGTLDDLRNKANEFIDGVYNIFGGEE